MGEGYTASIRNIFNDSLDERFETQNKMLHNIRDRVGVKSEPKRNVWEVGVQQTSILMQHNIWTTPNEKHININSLFAG
jgi:hypothetical protein